MMQFGMARLISALLPLGAAATLGTGLTVQISDQVMNGAFIPAEYFSYFTIQTMLANLVALTAAGLFRLRSHADTVLLTTVRKALFAYAVVTGLVYNLLLRGLPDGPGYVSDIGFPNEILHVVIPVYLVLDWIFTPHHTRVPWSGLWIGLIYPIVWVSFSFGRGAITGWYPYDFLDPRGPAGWAGVMAHVVGIAALLLVLLGLAAWINRLYYRRRGI